MNNHISIFTDGSSRGNPGPGGWGTVVVDNTKVTELGGAERDTTNNRMELMAALEGISHTPKNSLIRLYSDSSYVINGITAWIKGWKRNGWITKAKADVLNKDLWMKLDESVQSRNIEWKYVGGHVGIAGNERCDEIATAFADGEKLELYKGSLGQYDVPNILDISHDESSLAKKDSKSSHSKAMAYSYVSRVGGVIEVHHSWAECEKRVKGVRGVRYKKAISAEDEAKIIAEFKSGS